MRGLLAGLGARLRGLWHRDRLRREHAEELRLHLELQAERLEREGLPHEEALRRARLAFGNPEVLREASTDAFAFGRLEDWARDLRLAGRRLRRAPGFCAVAVATLALGVGANTALFSVLDALLLRPLPYPEPARLAVIDEVRRATGESMAISPANLADWHVPAFESVVAWATESYDLSGAGDPETLLGQVVGPGYFELLRVMPALGRPFVAADFELSGPAVVLVSDGLWRGRFAGDPGLVGRDIALDGTPHRVIGVLPAGFRAPGELNGTRPFQVHLPVRLPAEMMTRRSEHLAKALGRLTPGATLEQARAQLAAVSDRLSAQYAENREVRAVATALHEQVVAETASTVVLLQAAAAVVLLLACANLAGLFVVRGLGRSHEVAVRAALGARRGTLVREALAEAVLVAALAGLAGAAMAPGILAALKRAAPAGTPLLAGIDFDARGLIAALVLTSLCAMLTGLLPALRVAARAPGDVLKAGDPRAGRGDARWGGRLVVAQVALTLALLTGGVLLLRSLATLTAVPLGFDTERILCATLNLPASRYRDAAARLRFFETLEARVAALPGVEAVGFANRFPLRGGWGTGVFVDGMPETSRPREADAQAVSPSYFATLAVPLLAGRAFTTADSAQAEPVVVVNQAFVREHFAGREAIGRRVRRHSEAPWARVVGVVRDLHRDGPAEPAQPQVYYAAAQTAMYPVRLSDLALRTRLPRASVLPALQREVWALDPQQPLNRVATLAEAIDRNLEPRRFATTGLVGLALVALLLALLGVYGTSAYALSRRVPELGVRLALGAAPSRLRRLVIAEATRRVVQGALLGLPLALVVARSLESQLFGLSPLDLGSMAAAILLLVAGGLLAALPVASRAARIDPATALRVE